MAPGPAGAGPEGGAAPEAPTGQPRAAGEVQAGGLAGLAYDPENANAGTDRGQAMLEESIRRYGAGRSVVVDRRGVLIGGNKTVAAAAAAGLTKTIVVPTTGDELVVVQRTDLDLEADPRAKELAIADNRVQQVSLRWDTEVLERLAASGADLGRFWTQDELAELIKNPAAKVTAGVDLERLDELTAKWGAATGTWWRIPSKATRGEHRLICGDATDRATVEALCGGERPVLFSTDPPYGVAYSGDNRPAGRRKDWSAVYEEVGRADYEPFLRKVLEAAMAVLDDRAAWYLWHAHKHAGMIDRLWGESSGS